MKSNFRPVNRRTNLSVARAPFSRSNRAIQLFLSSKFLL